MDRTYEVDVDAETIRIEGEWLGREALAAKIKKMIDSQDYRIGEAGAALEFLQSTVAQARQFEVKLMDRDATNLERHAQRAGVSVSTFLRQAVQAYLAAQPPLSEGETTITTEPAKPGDESGAVELTRQKPQTSSKVLVDPSLQTEASSAPSSEDTWPKK